MVQTGGDGPPQHGGTTMMTRTDDDATETRTVTETKEVSFDGPSELVGFLTGAAKTCDDIVLNGQTGEDKLDIEVELDCENIPLATSVTGNATVRLDATALVTCTLADGDTDPDSSKFVNPSWFDTATFVRRVTVPTRHSRIGDEISPDKSNGYPGRAGYTHNGAAWCCECAEGHEDIDTSPQSDAVILADTETDTAQTCDHCGITLPTRVIGGDA